MVSQKTLATSACRQTLKKWQLPSKCAERKCNVLKNVIGSCKKKKFGGRKKKELEVRRNKIDLISKTKIGCRRIFLIGITKGNVVTIIEKK